jgi:uncharacterized membrane protein
VGAAWPWRRRALYGLCLLASGALAGRLLFLPFHARFAAGYGHLLPWTGSRTSLPDWALLHGLFLVPATVTLLLLAARRWRNGRLSPGAAFLGFLTCVAGALVLGVEWVAMEGDAGRMNTVFKFYFQAWAICAASCAAGTLLMAAATGARSTASPRARRILTGALWLTATVYGCGAFYAFGAIPSRCADRFPGVSVRGLDGAAFMESAVYASDKAVFPLKWDRMAIRWLQDNVSGSPVILEGHAAEYGWAGRYSVHTGLPAVIGWRWHQLQQRRPLGAGLIDRRIDQVREIYTGTDASRALALLRRHRVGYVVVGPLERTLYPREGLAKFSEQDGILWSAVHANPGVTIYRVADPETDGVRERSPDGGGQAKPAQRGDTIGPAAGFDRELGDPESGQSRIPAHENVRRE